MRRILAAAFVAMLALPLAGCPSVFTDEERTEAQATVDRISAAVTIARSLVGIYTALPECVEAGPVLCSVPDVSLVIILAFDNAEAGLAAAKAALSAGSDEEAVAIAVAAAITAANELNTAIAGIQKTPARDLVVG